MTPGTIITPREGAVSQKRGASPKKQAQLKIGPGSPLTDPWACTIELSLRSAGDFPDG